MSKIILEEQAEQPTPGADKIALYPKAGGGFYKKNDEGIEVQLDPIKTSAYVKVSDMKAYNAHGGNFEQDAWRTRDINAENSDDSDICSISSNQITLEIGTYICSISCPGYRVLEHVAQLYNITDSAMEILGIAAWAVDPGQSRASVVGKFVITAQKIFEVRHYCRATYESGFGVATSIIGIDSIYTVAEFWRI